MLKETGRYYVIPLMGCAIQQIEYNGLVRLVFADADERVFLDLHGEFQVEASGHITTFSPRQKEALLLFFDWFQTNVTIEEAKADKQGQLFLKLSNRQELIVQDGPFENWHFTILNRQSPSKNLFVHGGVGTTYF
ncbi:DUF6188 family protein [Hymenobacter perfusus]|uniref:Uncharacterized protein n=1 Tax=Hymenobacter perfusus TaxID=1236770 RepID=A0A3R9PNG2_9BACT|nr:DUF6188 family protein [Hymenobacter perfusus]RSK42300.1 hypothetical protein EI293_15375 [Hymenobacter perfusus]